MSMTSSCTTQDNPTSTVFSARDAQICDAQNRVISGMVSVPEPARSTITTTGQVDVGLACKVEQGKFSTVMDLGCAMGGDASAPSPGFFARAGIVGCVAIAIKMSATRAGLTFRKVVVDVETDFDDLAIFGLGNSSAAPTETRVNIEIDSDEDIMKINALVERTLEMDPWFLALRDPQRVATHVTVNKA